MALRQTKKISELPALSPASLDTTFVVGISGSTTYKISINNLTSSLDTTFATDLVTNALSNTLDTKLSTSSFNSYTASISTGSLVTSISNLNTFTASVTTASIVTSISNLNTFTASQSTSSLVDRLNTIESVSGSWITESETSSFLTSLNGAISSSTQISDLGFVTGSYTTITSFNSLTQSFNSISQSFNVISGSVGTIDFSTLATTGSNIFIGNQTINGALEISQSIHNWEFGTDGILKLNNGYGEIYADADSGSVRIGTAAENVAPNAQIIIGGFNEVFKIKSGPPLREWTFEGNGDFNLSGSIVGASNLATTASNTFIGNQTISGSTYISGGLDIKNNGYSWSFESNGRTKIPNITFNSDRGTGMVGIKPVAGREFQIETSTTSSTVGPWVFGLDGTLSAPNGANILRVGNLVTTESFNSFTQSYYSASSSFDTRIDSLENATSSYLTSLSGAISSSSQLTSSYDTRYTLSGSVQPLPSNLVSSSAQITAFGFISSSTTINTSSFATTGSNSFNGNQNITGSLVVSAVAVVAGALTIPSASVISLTSGSSISVDASGAITGSLTGSVFGIGDVVAFSASLNSRIISGSAVAGTISGSSQLTSSYDSRYSLSGSVLTSFSSSVDNRLDTLEASIITGSANYTQVLGNRRTGITTIGVSIISGSITTTGNPVQIMVTGDANPTTTAWCRLQIFRDGNGIGNIVQVENSSNLNVPYCLNVIDTPSAGTYTYSMRTVDAMAGFFDFGESTGPLLTAVELKTNTNLPSTNNTFTGTNTFRGETTFSSSVKIAALGGDEGGEILLAKPQTNSTISGSAVAIDIYQDRLRIFEGGGNARGAHLDLSKLPEGVAGELMWKVSGFVNAGTFVSLDNIKATITTSGQRGLSIAAVSTSFTANISSTFGFTGGGAGSSTTGFSVTTTPSNSLFNYGFNTEGDGSTYIINDKTNNRVYRITKMIGFSFNNNFISIERLF